MDLAKKLTLLSSSSEKKVFTVNIVTSFITPTTELRVKSGLLGYQVERREMWGKARVRDYCKKKKEL